MAKVTIGEFTYEGTPAEIKEIFETMGGVKFPEVAEERFEIGDYVKVISLLSIDGSYRDDVKIGDIGEIIKVDGSDIPYNFKRLSDGETAWFKKDGVLARATDAEIAKVKLEILQKQAEEEKWAKIERQPNELKEGDFVKYRNCNAEVTRVGLYDISILIPNGDIIAVSFDAVSLIAPIEYRFDKDSE